MAGDHNGLVDISYAQPIHDGIASCLLARYHGHPIRRQSNRLHNRWAPEKTD